MNWQRRDEENTPQHPSPLFDEPQIPQTRSANFEPCALRMGPVNICARRRTETLHAIVACVEKESRQDVDYKVQARSPSLGEAAAPFKDAERRYAVVFIHDIAQDYGDDSENNVDNGDSGRAQCTYHHSSNPFIARLRVE